MDRTGIHGSDVQFMKRVARLQEVFDRWLSAAKKDLDVVRGWQSARLLETDASDGGRLRVHFSSRLSSVVTAVRSVAALGFKIPRELDSAVQVLILQTQDVDLCSRHCFTY